jgi:hypothetical protein
VVGAGRGVIDRPRLRPRANGTNGWPPALTRLAG